MDFSAGDMDNQNVDLTQESDAGDIRSQDVNAFQEDDSTMRHMLAYTPEEQADYAAQGFVPVNIEMRPDANDPTKMREHVFPGTWDDFTGIRFAGANNDELELQLARKHGLRVNIPRGDPIVRQFLIAKLYAKEQQQQQPGLAQPLIAGGAHEPLATPSDLAGSAQPQINLDRATQPDPQPPLSQPAPDSGNAAMSDAPADASNVLQPHGSKFVKNWNKRQKTGGGDDDIWR